MCCFCWRSVTCTNDCTTRESSSNPCSGRQREQVSQPTNQQQPGGWSYLCIGKPKHFFPAYLTSHWYRELTEEDPVHLTGVIQKLQVSIQWQHHGGMITGGLMVE